MAVRADAIDLEIYSFHDLVKLQGALNESFLITIRP